MNSFRVAFSGLCFLRLAEEHHTDGKHFVQGPITSSFLVAVWESSPVAVSLGLGLNLNSLTAELQVTPQPIPGSRNPWCFANLCYPLHFKHKTKQLPFWNLYQRHFSCNPFTTFGTYGVFENSLCLNFKSENGERERESTRTHVCSVLQNALLVCSSIDLSFDDSKYLTPWSARTWHDLPVAWNHHGVYSFMLYPGTTGVFSALESAVPSMCSCCCHVPLASWSLPAAAHAAHILVYLLTSHLLLRWLHIIAAAFASSSSP